MAENQSSGKDVAPKSTVVVYSGGLDSTTLLYQLLEQGVDVKGALTIDYGQRHRKEIENASAICAELGINHRCVDLTSLASLFGHSSLTDSDMAVPHGHYEEESMKSTVVPNRNMILLSTATAWAISLGADTVAYAAHSGDHAIYPDCREDFASALDAAMQLADWHVVSLYRPFVTMDKTGIAREAARLSVPIEKTWSCYEGGEKHCGRCGTCVERREALHLAGVDDPTTYAESAPSLEDMIAMDWRISE